MGKKYIIEIEDGKEGIILCQKGIVTVGLRLENESELKPLGIQSAIPYTEPDLEQVGKEAYEKGWKDAEDHYDDGYGDGYDAGLDDAWKAARKIVMMPDRDFINSDILDLDPGESIFTKYTASEAIEKLKAYEQEQDEIKVGDEIEAVSGKAVVVYVDDVDEHKVRYVYSNGVYAFDYIDKVTKTGRHFPEIAAVLEKMREGRE